jgi:transcriptional regulator with XRE-family HTH domain
VVQSGKINSGFNLGQRLAQLRRARGLTQDELAERMGIERETVSRAERGLTDPPLSKLIEICKVLDFPVAELITRASTNLPDHAKRINDALSSCAEPDRELLCEIIEKMARRLAARPAPARK